MNLAKSQKRKWNFLALAFLFPLIGMLMVMLFSGYKPFGKYSMLYSDMYHQYYPFFIAFRNTLRSGKSLLYSWNIGMGMDYLGLISYYLASPLNLLSVLVPESLTLEFFSLLMPIKLGFAGLFFAVFLKKTYQKDDLSIAIFGCFYALCAWALGYQWNVMWLDTFALLPLVVLGTVALLEKKKFVLYTFTLFLSIFSNYYIGFFICIFVLLLFICYEICRFQSLKKLFSDLIRIAFFSLLAIGMTAVLELPALAALQTTQSSVNNFPTGFKLNIASENTWKGLLDAMRQVAGNMGGGLEPTFKEGLPNLYCGVGSLSLAFLFLTEKRVPLKEKLCSVFLLIFFSLSFIIRQLDYIWHGFHFTNMIPYRFSFLFSFVVLWMAYRAYLLKDRFQPWQIVISGLLSLGILACSDSRTDLVYLAYNLAFLLLYISVLLYAAYGKGKYRGNDEAEKARRYMQQKKRRRNAQLVLSVVLALEIALNLVNFGINFPGTSVSNYPKGTTYAASMIRYMKEREHLNPFYRAEATHSQTLNDGALNGYNGISAFTSSANVKVTEFMRSLGYSAKNTYNRYCYEESSPIPNLFLGLKYMLARDGNVQENHYFEEVHHYGDVYLLKNTAYLPLGFLTEIPLSALDFSRNTDRFEFQNELLRASSGVTEKAWHTIGNANLTITGENVEITNQTASGYCKYNASQSGTITYTYVADRTGLVCIDLNLGGRNTFTVHKNGAELYSEGYSLPQMLSVSDVVPGDIIEVKLAVKKDESSSMTVTAAILDDEIFQEAYSVLSASTLQLSYFDETHVEGFINCNRDGLLYTSIPQNGNWKVIVDGQPAQTVLVGDVMLSIPLTEGNHDIIIYYQNSAYTLGRSISFVCLGIFLICCWCCRSKRKKGKFEKNHK